jgi:glycosyltransferase involved in cell wall biosynthesis
MSERRVVVDADVLGRRRTGDESYVENLLRELAALRPGFQLTAVTRAADLVPAGVEAQILPAQSQLLRMGVRLPRLLRRLAPNLSHFLHVVPPRAPGRVVLTIQDISFERRPELMNRRDRLLFRTLVPRSVKQADRILVGSEWTRGDLVDRYNVPQEKVVVTPYGVDPHFGTGGPTRNTAPYLLVVGALQPRKDPVRALEALALLDSDLRLVFAGPGKGSVTDVRDGVRRLRLGPRVEVAGYVDKAELASLYRGAACLVFPSLYEGFGLPMVEAMASGTPVVATTAGALPEVAGEAAILVEPGNAEALAAGVEQALAERDRLVAAGLERSRRFSWVDTARRTLSVYEELL